MMRILVTMLIGLALVACGGKDDHDHAHDDGHDHGAEDAHHEDHSAQHGGELLEFGKHEGHVEVVHEDETGTVRIWIYDGEMKPLNLDGAPTLSFLADGASKQLTAAGSGSEWTFTDVSLKGEPEKARFKLVAKGKPFTPPWEH